MKILAAIVLLAAPLLPQEKKGKAPPEPKVWMCEKGDLLWEEKFEGTAFSKDWHKGQGDWKIEGGVLSGAELPADKHHAYCSRKVADPNAVIQFSFKLEGDGWLGAFFDGKEHVAALQILPDGLRIRRMSGMGPTTKSSEIDSSKIKTKLNDGAWHTVVWEVFNDEMVATIDDKELVLAKADGLSTERLHLELNTGGGPTARFKDVKVWKAPQQSKLWPQQKARLMQVLKKKPAKS